MVKVAAGESAMGGLLGLAGGPRIGTPHQEPTGPPRPGRAGQPPAQEGLMYQVPSTLIIGTRGSVDDPLFLAALYAFANPASEEGSPLLGLWFVRQSPPRHNLSASITTRARSPTTIVSPTLKPFTVASFGRLSFHCFLTLFW